MDTWWNFGHELKKKKKKMKERNKNTLNTLRRYATLDRRVLWPCLPSLSGQWETNTINLCVSLQVSTYKQFVAALASPNAPPRVGRIMEQLVHQDRSMSYILDVLVGAADYFSDFFRNEKQLSILYLKVGGSGLIHATK